MSRFRLPNFQDITSRFARLCQSGNKSKPAAGAGKPRRLVIDPLERRELLAVSTPAQVADVAVNEGMGSDQFTIAGQSIGVDNDGDFVVVWTRYDDLLDELGNPYIDADTGLILTDANIYARYFTDEVQRITLPENVLVDNDDDPTTVGTISINYGGTELQTVSFSQTTPPAYDFAGLITGTYALVFDIDGNGVIGANETTAPIAFTDPAGFFAAADPALMDANALAMQDALRAISGVPGNEALAEVVVTPLAAYDYQIEFVGQEGIDQPELFSNPDEMNLGEIDSQLSSLSLDQATINAVGLSIVTGSFTDADTLATYTVMVDWGDGTQGNATVNQVTRTFSAFHNYTDGADDHDVDVTLSDDFGFGDSASMTVNISKVDPILTSVVVDRVGVAANDVITVTGTFIGTGDSVRVNWGDFSSSNATLDLVNGTFTATHQYFWGGTRDIDVTFSEGGVAITASTSVTASTFGTAAFLPAVMVTTTRNPADITDIPIVPGSPTETEEAIREAFLVATGQEFVIGPSVIPFPMFEPVDRYAGLPRVQVDSVPTPEDPNGERTFDIRFVLESGKIDHPELVITAVDDTGTPIDVGADPVRTLKQTSDEFRVNSEEPNNPFTQSPDKYNQTSPAVAMDADGDFIITWQSEVPNKYSSAGQVVESSVTDIFAQRFSPTGHVTEDADITFRTDVDLDGVADVIHGVKPLGNEFRVNTFTANAQFTPHVGMDADGDFVITWASDGQSNSFFNGVKAQQYNRDGDRLGGEWLVNDEDTELHRAPWVGVSDDGHFAISWVTSGALMAEIYNPDGNVLAAEFVVQAGGALQSIDFDTANNMIIGWSEIRDADNTGGTSVGVFARLYELFQDDGTFALSVLQDDFRANSASMAADGAVTWPNAQLGGQVAIDADGDITISYDGFGPDVSEDVMLTSSLFDRLNEPQNADLAPYFQGFLSAFFPIDNIGDVTGALEAVLI
ncbi:MAG: hypothetical protein HQ581_18545, partial [Planctomycetes bacterium]|nr:hypothetical protein [Planctomycetota bacterium]